MLAHEEIYFFPAQLRLDPAQRDLPPPYTPQHTHTHTHKLSVELALITFWEGKPPVLCQMQSTNPREFQGICITGLGEGHGHIGNVASLGKLNANPGVRQLCDVSGRLLLWSSACSFIKWGQY